ncbi:hypothetical protein EDB83DRAFT_80236 [Lactarius deliciosus]|nr:hypothetical protein EDB83DRAFT_80236 [Lactarius deliciosus]
MAGPQPLASLCRLCLGIGSAAVTSGLTPLSCAAAKNVFVCAEVSPAFFVSGTFGVSGSPFRLAEAEADSGEGVCSLVTVASVWDGVRVLLRNGWGVFGGKFPGTMLGWRGVDEGRLPWRRLGWHGFRGRGKVSSLLGFKSSTTSALLESCSTSATAPAEMARLPFVSPALPRKLLAKVGHTQTKPLTILLVVDRFTLLPNEGGHACRWRSCRDRRRGMCGCRTTRSRTGGQWVLNRNTRVARTPERTEFRVRARRWGVPDTTLGPRIRVPQTGRCWRSWPLHGDRRGRY